MPMSQLYGTPFNQTATNATSAVASQAGAANTRYYVTDICASSDKAGAIILVKDGTTTIWQDIVGASSYRHSFKTPLMGTIGNLVSVTIDGTSACKANISGYSILTS